MSLIQRAQDILLKPKDTWPAIAAEPATVASIYRSWLVILAAVPALASFIGLSLVGFSVGPVSFRVPLLTGLAHLVVGYVLSLVAVFVLSLIVDALAPTFGGRKDPVAALKVVAYGATAGFLGGVFNLIPALSVLGLLAALYSIYLVYTGLPVLMGNPPDKSVAYTAVVIVCGIVAMVLLGSVTSAFMPARAPGLGSLPGGEVRLGAAVREAQAPLERLAAAGGARQ